MSLSAKLEASTANPRRVLSGMRPTGKLHLGNYVGALKNWVRLQGERDAAGARRYDCYFFIADYHALTTDYADPGMVAQNTLDVALDWLGAGLDPEQCVMFVQSHVPQHAELHLLLSMITPLSWLERVPSYKEQQENLTGKDLSTYGFLGYPLLQSADILLYQATDVPVGQDQVAHIELTREVARRFNHFALPPDYKEQSPDEWLINSHTTTSEPVAGAGWKVLPEPQALLTPSPKLPGTDGRKMSKSYGNTILLTDLPTAVDRKLRNMTNGGQRELASIPGNPQICPVGDLHRVFSTTEIVSTIESACSTAKITCIDCKGLAAISISDELSQIQAKRSQFDTDQSRVLEILRDGAARAQNRAQETMRQVKSALGIPLNLSRASVKPMISRMLTDDRAVRHDLSGEQWSESWNTADRKKRGDTLRAYWLETMLPSDLQVRSIAERTYVTDKGKRLYVSTARQGSDEGWRLEVRNKTFEALVFLLWGNDRILTDLVIPQRLYRAAWPLLDKKVKFFHAYVQFHEDQYYLSLNDPYHLGIALGYPIGNRAYQEIR